MVPQQASVNRKLTKESNLARWDEFEKWMLLEISRKNTIRFTIKVNYDNASGCRPVSFEVDAYSSAKSSTGFKDTFVNRPNDQFKTSSATLKEAVTFRLFRLVTTRCGGSETNLFCFFFNTVLRR